MTRTYPNGPKTGWLSQANQIANGIIPTSESDIPLLLCWLKDMNWPGATEIACHLRKFGRTMLPHIVDVLTSNDLIWARGVLDVYYDAFDRDFWELLRPYLEQYAFTIDAEGLHISCLRVLAKYNLCQLDIIKTSVEKMKKTHGVDPSDYHTIEALL